MIRLSKETLGDYFVDEWGALWQHICYSDRPTASLRRVDRPDEQRGGVVGAPIFNGFRRLVPEEEA